MIGLLSSDEFTPPARASDTALLAASRARSIGLILCADHRAASHSARTAARHFTAANFPDHGGPLSVATLEHGEGFEDVDLLYIGGGSPVDLTACTLLRNRWPLIEARWRAGDLHLAGSSAGAMALCTYTLVPTPGANAPTRWTTEGFGPLERMGLAVHASSRTDEWLGLVAQTKPPGVTLLALDDAACVILRPGAAPTTIGRVRAL